MRGIHLQDILGRYISVVLLASVIITLASFMLKGLGVSVPTSAGILVSIIAAFDGGRIFTHLNSRLPTPTERWQISVLMLAVNLLLVAVLLAALWGPLKLLFAHVVLPDGFIPFILSNAVLIIVSHLLATWVFWGFGGRYEMKSLEDAPN